MTDALLRDEKGRLLPGTPPGPGRPKGSGMSLKEYASKKFREMAEEDKEKFIKDIAKDIVWKMAEGNPATENTGELTHKVQILPSEIIEKNDIQVSHQPEPNSEGQKQI